MKKTFNTTKQVKTIETFCDICGEEIKLYSYSAKICLFCKKDLCYKCRVDIPEETDYSGDYQDYVCKSCYVISRPFYKQIKEIEEKADEETEAIRDKMLDIINKRS